MYHGSTLKIVLGHNSYPWQTLPLSVLKVISVEIYFCLIGYVRAEEISWAQQSKILLVMITTDVNHALKNQDRIGELLADFYNVVFTQIYFGRQSA